ncbi:unnamed protein product [Parascedosporium putredinis]|uniref:Shikimate dehydrogenase substrate binding N-terminal domain-containing protein n=1 Tax=Parascedosporium putredinis TaxID=1442378 RepID=A0A9P1GXA3_9PEZI|nr:unnamed protein product [Parascedosporium putredinis]CAI7989606.1 unnamed protein product [Parascedosporium putredinis]
MAMELMGADKGKREKKTWPPPTKTTQSPASTVTATFWQEDHKVSIPYLHSVIYQDLGLQWAQTRLDSDDIPAFLELIKDPQFYGASVTMPNKVAIIPHLDELTPECRDVGACNTIFLRTAPDGRRLFCGANTDTVGIRESFFRNVDKSLFAGRPAMVIGGGGAARSAIYALRTWMDVGDIYIVNRDRAEVDAVFAECEAKGYGAGLVRLETIEEARAAEAPGAIVACVPDFPPKTEAELRTRAVIETILGKERKGAMLEMCYNPSPFTALGGLLRSRAGRSSWAPRRWCGRVLSRTVTGPAGTLVSCLLPRCSAPLATW